MTQNKQDSLALAGGIYGIVNASLSFIFSWFLAPLFVVSCVVSLVLSAVGLKKARLAGTSAGWAITGLATSIPTLVWNLFWSIILILAAVGSSSTY